jgi:putative restriction endonuclease
MEDSGITLFVRGYLTVSPDYRVEVSRRLKDEFDNGKEYYTLHAKTILLPENLMFGPSTEYFQLTPYLSPRIATNRQPRM